MNVKYEVLKRGKVVKTLSAPEDTDMIDLLANTMQEIRGVDSIRRAERSSGESGYLVSVDRKTGAVGGEDVSTARDEIRRAERSWGEPEYFVSVNQRLGTAGGESVSTARSAPYVEVRIDALGNVTRDE